MIAAKVARLSKTMAGKAAPAASMHIPSVVPYHTKPSDDVQGTRIHRLIDQKGTIVLPGCYDALSASIIQKSGFHAGYISGYSVSASLLGKPDIGFLTPPEMATAARTLCEAAPSVPFIADADTGGGSALNVTRTVKDLIKAGAAGCFLEDQAWPKKCGHMQGKQVIPADDHAAKIAAAREAIGDADFFLVARTDARATSAKYGLAEAISRANLYMDAGADACFVEAPRDEDELKEIARRTRGIRVCNMIEGGLTPMHTPEVFNKMGFHIIIYSTTMLYACSRAMLDVMTTLRETGTTKAHFNKMASFKDFNQLVNLDSWLDVEARFSSFQKDQPAKEASSSA